MLYNLLNLYQLIKKPYLLLAYMYLGLYIIIFITTSFTKNIALFNILLGCPPYTSSIQILWTIFQISCHIYIVFTYLSYEQDSSYEYIILRESYKKILCKKVLVILVATVVLRLFIFFGTYLLFYSKIDFSMTSFFYNIGLYIAVAIVTVIVQMMIKKESTK